jgi:hypothetical protein
MFEYVKYNCHVMIKNDVGDKNPAMLTNDYNSNRKNGVDYVFDGVDCIVDSVKYDSSKSSIITKISRKDDTII